MMVLVADASGLVNRGIAADQGPDPLSLCLTTCDVRVPETTVDELRETASSEDEYGQAARSLIETS